MKILEIVKCMFKGVPTLKTFCFIFGDKRCTILYIIVRSVYSLFFRYISTLLQQWGAFKKNEDLSLKTNFNLFGRIRWSSSLIFHGTRDLIEPNPNLDLAKYSAYFDTFVSAWISCFTFEIYLGDLQKFVLCLWAFPEIIRFQHNLFSFDTDTLNIFWCFYQVKFTTIHFGSYS